jgi:hypothetical protein
VINGCYKTQNGQLRVIDPATGHCLPSETAISWNQNGPTGSQGPTGPRGPTGPKGSPAAMKPHSTRNPGPRRPPPHAHVRPPVRRPAGAECEQAQA